MGLARELFGSVVDLFFPEVCPFCDRIIYDKNTLVCSLCLRKIEFVRSPLCTCCGKHFPVELQDDHYCGECLTERRYFTKARALLFYEGEVMEAIHRFKYLSAIYLARTFGWLMWEYGRRFMDFKTYEVIIPVPLHKKRLRKRGFNQAQLLAQVISKFSGLPLELFALERVIDTHSQVGLRREERHMNISNAFRVQRKERIKNKSILLIDDVLSTTATVRETAKTLMRAGARQVDVLALARGRGESEYRGQKPEEL